MKNAFASQDVMKLRHRSTSHRYFRLRLLPQSAPLPGAFRARPAFATRARHRMKSLSPNVMANTGGAVVPGGWPETGSGKSTHAGVFAHRGNGNIPARPAWVEVCELARRAGDDLEGLAERLASTPDTDNPLDTSGTLVSSLRMYSAGKNSATAGRHDVAVESFTESLRHAVLAWNDARVDTSLHVAKALRLELKKHESDSSSVLVQAHRRVAGSVLSARAMSSLALGDLRSASLDSEAAVDCAPELALTHVCLGEVYNACGGRDGSVRAFQRASALAPTSIAISRRLDDARDAPAAPTPRGGWGGADATPAGKKVGTFDVSLDQVNAQWEATGLSHIKKHEWYDLRRKACPHGARLSPLHETDGNELFDDSKRDTKLNLAHHEITTEKYLEKELFAERAMSLYAKKRASGSALPENSTWLDLAFEAVNIDGLEAHEQVKLCVCMGNIFNWCADFSGADELYSYALEMDECESADGPLAGWRPLLLANRSLCRLRVNRPADAAMDAELCLKETGPRWGTGLCRMGQVMCAMGAWSKAEQTFRAAHRRATSGGGKPFAPLELEVKIALANSAGMGLPAAREAGEKVVDAVRAAKELQAVGELFDHMDAVVQLDALEPDVEIDPILGPTPRFMRGATTNDDDDDDDFLNDLPEVAPGLKPGKVRALGQDGKSLSEALSELDNKSGRADSQDTVEKDTNSKKRGRGGRGGEEVQSAVAAVDAVAAIDLEKPSEEPSKGFFEEPSGDTPKAQKIKTRGCSAGCGDFFGALFGSPAAETTKTEPAVSAYDEGAVEEMKAGTRKNK